MAIRKRAVETLSVTAYQIVSYHIYEYTPSFISIRIPIKLARNVVFILAILADVVYLGGALPVLICIRIQFNVARDRCTGKLFDPVFAAFARAQLKRLIGVTNLA